MEEAIDRQTRWVKAAHALVGIERSLIVVAQDLGRLDVELIGLDAAVHFNLQMTEHTWRKFVLSRLWVLGAYELVRTIESRLRPDDKTHDTISHQRAMDLKRKFERVRVPLAKLEHARRYPGDSHIAQPAVNPSTVGVAWEVGSGRGVFIERRELADSLLEFIEELYAATQRSSTTDP